MLHTRRHNVIKLMVALGYSTKYMKTVFRSIRKPKRQIIKLRGLTAWIADDQIVGLRYDQDYIPSPERAYSQRSYYSHLKVSSNPKYKPTDMDITPYHISILEQSKIVSSSHIDEETCEGYIENFDGLYTEKHLEDSLGDQFPMGIYLRDKGSCYTISQDEYYRRDGTFKSDTVYTSLGPSINEYNDFLHGLVILAKRGYWTKQTYKVYKEIPITYHFWYRCEYYDSDNWMDIKYTAIGDIITDIVVYDSVSTHPNYNFCLSEVYKIAVARKASKEESVFDTSKDWFEQYDFGFKLEFENAKEISLFSIYNHVYDSLENLKLAGYRCY